MIFFFFFGQDDPVCVAARAEGSKVVSELWVDDSLDRGVPADADRVHFAANCLFTLLQFSHRCHKFVQIRLKVAAFVTVIYFLLP